MQKFLLLLFIVSTTYALTLTQKPQESTLVIYNTNIALVQETNHCTLSPKDTTLIYPNVANSIIADSVSITMQPPIQILMQRYRSYKLSEQTLLNAYKGKKVGYKNLTCTLLDFDRNRALLQQVDGTIFNADIKEITFSALPQEIISTPSLVWDIHLNTKQKTTLSLEYLMKNISWNAIYSLQLHNTTATLQGWISIENKSSKSFQDTQISLLAGDVQTLSTTMQSVRYLKTTRVQDTPHVISKAFEGYHLYTLPFRVNLHQHETTQVHFITQKNIDIERLYKTRLNNPLYIQGEIQNNVTQYIKLNNLDIALPKGKVRTFGITGDTNIFLGESGIKHTPKNTPIELKIGKDFDTKVTQTLLQKEKKNNFTFIDIAYKITNNSNTHKVVTLLIPVSKNKGSKIMSQRSFSFTQGNLATFTLEVNPNTSLSFDVHFEIKK